MNNSNDIPEAIPQDAVINGVTVPQSVTTDIRHAAIAGAVLSVLALLAALLQWPDIQAVAAGAAYAALLATLSWRVYQHNRISAVLLFIVPVAAVLQSAWVADPGAAANTAVRTSGATTWVPMAVALYFLGKGVRGSFRLHRLLSTP
jgi:hypothetical protein